MPAGRPAVEVTRAEQNFLVELDGQPALERAEEVLRELPESERERLAGGLYIGRPVRGEASGPRDYLIRNLLGADRERGVIAVGDAVSEHERIRLHVRDAGTAREDLEMLLSPQPFDRAAEAALLFACNGRGRGLYGEPDGDISVLQGRSGRLGAGGRACSAPARLARSASAISCTGTPPASRSSARPERSGWSVRSRALGRPGLGVRPWCVPVGAAGGMRPSPTDRSAIPALVRFH